MSLESYSAWIMLSLQWDKRTNIVKQLICKPSVTQVACVARQLLIIMNENTGPPGVRHLIYHISFLYSMNMEIHI